MLLTKALMLAAAFQGLTPSLALSPERWDGRTPQACSAKKFDECTQDELDRFEQSSYPSEKLQRLKKLSEPRTQRRNDAPAGKKAEIEESVQAKGKTPKEYKKEYRELQQKECAELKRASIASLADYEGLIMYDVYDPSEKASCSVVFQEGDLIIREQSGLLGKATGAELKWYPERMGHRVKLLRKKCAELNRQASSNKAHVSQGRDGRGGKKGY